MKVLVTGATGFTGSYAVPQLLADNHHVRCFVRKSSDTSCIPTDQVELFYGDLNEPDSLKKALLGMDVLVNIASLGFGQADGIIAALKSSDVHRAIFVSTTAIYTKLNAPSKKIRMAAECSIEDSGIDYTILRPTMIYGGPRDRNICRLIKYLHRYPVLPVFGSGEFLLQPIYVGDVAQALADVLKSSQTKNNSYNISGMHPCSYNDLIDIVSGQLNKHILKWHISDKLVVPILKQVEKWVNIPIKAEQIQRLNENKSFSHDRAIQDFGFAPKSFSQGVALEIKKMNLI